MVFFKAVRFDLDRLDLGGVGLWFEAGLAWHA